MTWFSFYYHVEFELPIDLLPEPWKSGFVSVLLRKSRVLFIVSLLTPSWTAALGVLWALLPRILNCLPFSPRLWRSAPELSRWYIPGNLPHRLGTICRASWIGPSPFFVGLRDKRVLPQDPPPTCGGWRDHSFILCRGVCCGDLTMFPQTCIPRRITGYFVSDRETPNWGKKFCSGVRA